MRLELDVFGDVQVSREILRYGEHANDARPAFRQMTQMLEQAERRQFDTQGGFASGGWAPLKPETVRAKVRKHQDPRILRATGALEASLTHGGSGARRHVGSQELIYGTDIEYARFHQHGTRRMPQRRPLETTKNMRVQLMKVLQRWIVRGEVK